MKKKLNFKATELKRTLLPAQNAFLSLARSIVGQQISIKAAASINARLLSLFGKRKPSPTLLLSFTDKQLKEAGLSRSKVIYLRDLADKFLDKTIDPRKFPQMSDAEIKEHLTQVKGIGPWTADMFLIFALNRPNILPVGDLAIKKGFQKAFNLKLMPDEKKMRALAKEHEGEHTNLSLYLWQILDENAEWE
ncbi:MAG: DNA-3-methyladenine glycosylase [Parcubacteria group bacterium]|nr:DNA-3-methyladenine glycosylase [Parcubacteria group bacterium]